MPHSMRRALPVLPVLLSVLLVAVVGCGSDPEGDDGPSRAAEPEAATGFCSVITDETLTEIAGRPQTVGEPTTQGTKEVCRTLRDSDDALRVLWSVQRSTLGLEDLVDSEGAGRLDPSVVELAGADEPVPATLLTGEVAGTRMVKVVVELDGRVLVTEASSMDLGIDEPVPDSELREVAIDVAEEYVRAGLPAPSAQE